MMSFPYSWRGIDIVPSEDVPCGYRRTEGDTIFINPTNYEYLRPLSAKGTLIMLGFLPELQKTGAPHAK